MAGLSIRSLRVFDRILAAGTLSAAAEQLHMSQSAASRQLIELEQAIGLKLFERTNRHLVPTSAGMRFYAETQHVLAGIDEIPSIVESIKAGVRETLSVVCMPRLSLGLLVRAIEKFEAVRPAIGVSVSVLRNHDIKRWATARHFDIGVGMLPILHPELRTETICNVRAVAIVPPDHPLAGAKDIGIEQLAHERLIGYEPGLVVREQVDDLFRSAGITARYTQEVSATLLAAQLAMRGCGIAILDAISVSQLAPFAPGTLVPVRPTRWWPIGCFRRQRETVSQFHVAFRDAVHAAALDIRNLLDDPSLIKMTPSK
ncbi:MAG: LysR family transcriptional regulator [Pseudomonadota bacterium]